MRTAVLILTVALAGCLLDTTPNEVEAESSTQAATILTCNPSARFEEWLAARSKVTLDTCAIGIRFWSDDVVTPAVFCWYESPNTGDWIYRMYGEVRPGLRKANQLVFEVAACQFNECDLWTTRVRCGCSVCVEL